MRKLIYTLLLFTFIPIDVGAIHEVIDSRCTNSLKMSLREEAQEVVYRLSKTINDDDVSYTLYFYNLTENMQLIGPDEQIYYGSKVENLKPGTTFVINFYASDKTYCAGYRIASKIIKVPYYNPYFGSELCRGYENYSLCKEDANVSLTEDEFIKKLDDYKESLKEKEEDETNDKIVIEDSFSIYDLFMSYRSYILGILVIILIALIIIEISKHKKNGGIL